MKLFIKRAISVLITICLFIVILHKNIEITKRKDSVARNNDFFELDEDYDVLFFGSSHVMNGIFPMELWNDYGIISWNFEGAANRIPTSYWIMMNAFDYTEPEIVVIDIFNLSLEEKYKTTTKNLHDALDVFPLSETKINAVKDLIDDESLRAEYLFDYVTYHNRWNALEKSDFKESSYNTKGAIIKEDIVAPKAMEITDKVLQEESVNMVYLKKMIGECQNRDIEVVLTCLPFGAEEFRYEEANTAQKIAEEYDVPYINFLVMDGVVDYSVDFADESGHLNSSGAIKVTDYIGNYLLENYELSDKRNVTDYSSWNDDYDSYLREKINNIKRQTELDSYLMLMNDDSFSSIIEIENISILEEQNIRNLLIGLELDLPRIDNATIVVCDTKNANVEYFYGMKESFEENETSLGALKYISKNQSIRLRLNDNTCWYIDEGAENDYDIRIAVVDNRTGLEVDNISFTIGEEKIKHYN